LPAADRGAGTAAARMGLRPLPTGHPALLCRHGRRLVRYPDDRRAPRGGHDRLPGLRGCASPRRRGRDADTVALRGVRTVWALAPRPPARVGGAALGYRLKSSELRLGSARRKIAVESKLAATPPRA